MVGEASVLKTSEMLESVSQRERKTAELALGLAAYACVAMFRRGSTLGTELLEK